MSGQDHSVECPTCLTLLPASERFCPACGRPRATEEQRLRRLADSTGTPYATLLRAERRAAGVASPVERVAQLERELRAVATRLESFEAQLRATSAAPSAPSEADEAPEPAEAVDVLATVIPEPSVPAEDMLITSPLTGDAIVEERPQQDAIPTPDVVPDELREAPADMPADAQPTMGHAVLPATAAVPPVASWPPPPPDEPLRPAWQAADWEQLLSGRVLAVVGGLAILVGAVFFLSLAFSRGWIGPSLRVTIGLLASALMLGLGGWIFEKRRPEWIVGHVLVAVGLGVVNVSLLSAVRLYDLIPAELGLVGALLAASVAALIAIRADEQLLAAYGLVAALAAPPVLGADPNLVAIAFLAVTLIGTTSISLYRSWWWLPSLAFLCSAPQFAAWVAGGAGATAGLPALAGFWLLYALSAGGEEFRVRSDALRPTSATLMLANAAFVVGAGFGLLDGNADGWRGTFLLAVALAHAALGAYFLRAEGEYHPFGLLALGTGLAALSMAVPIQLGGPPVPLAWAAEAAALAWVYGQRRHRYSAGAAVVLGALAVAHLIVFEYRPDRIALDSSSRWPFLGAAGGTLAFLLGALLVAGIVARVRWLWQLLSVLGIALVLYALPFELSGVVLLASWAALVVAAFALTRVPQLAPNATTRAYLGPLGACMLPAGAAATLALGHYLTYDAPLEQVGSLVYPQTPFTDTATLATILLVLSALTGGWMTRLAAARVAGVLAATALLAYLVPFELRPAPMAATWAALALGLGLVARIDRAGVTAYLTGASLLLGSASLALSASVAPYERLGEPASRRLADTPFWDGPTLVSVALAVALLGLYGLWRGRSHSHWLPVWAAGALAYLLPFELRATGMTVGWAALAGGLALLARRDRAGGAAQLGAVLTLLAGATLAIVSALAPLGRIDDPARTRVANPAFWNGATLATAAVVAALLGTFVLWRAERLARWLPIWAAGLALYLMPFQLRPAPMVAAWIVVALGLLWLPRVHVDGAREYTVSSWATAGLALCVTLAAVAPPSRLAVDASTHFGGLPFFSGASLALAALIAFVSVAWRLQSDAPWARWLPVAAGGLAVYLLSVGVVDVFQRRVGGASDLAALRKQAQVALSILWGVLGVGAFLAGITRRVALLRMAGLVLLALTTLKVFIFDLASLDASYRVLSFVGLGVLLLVSSFAYQRLMPPTARDGDGHAPAP